MCGVGRAPGVVVVGGGGGAGMGVEAGAGIVVSLVVSRRVKISWVLGIGIVECGRWATPRLYGVREGGAFLSAGV